MSALSVLGFDADGRQVSCLQLAQGDALPLNYERWVTSARVFGVYFASGEMLTCFWASQEDREAGLEAPYQVALGATPAEMEVLG